MGKHTVTCHFCSMQDNLIFSSTPPFNSVHFESESALKVDYATTGRRACPRGNYCIELAQHKKRLAYSFLNKEIVKSSKALDRILNAFKSSDPDKIAILLSGSLTLEIAYLAVKVAKTSGVKWLASINFEDIVTSSFLNNFDFEQLSKMQLILSIGDIFSLNPTIARPIHDARFADRKNFLSTIDNCRSRTSRFAWLNLRSKPGKVADLVEALAKAAIGDKYSLEGLSIDKSTFEKLLNSLKDYEKVAILYSPGAGHFHNPDRIGFWAKKLAVSTDAMFAALSTSSNGRGISRILDVNGFGDLNGILKAIRNDKIENLICFGCDPIETFPRIAESISRIPFKVVTATLPTAITQISDVVIPTKHLFESTGTILSLEEKLIKLDDSYPVPDYPCEKAILSDILSSYGKSSVITDSELRTSLKSFSFVTESPAKREFNAGELYAIGFHYPHHHGDGSITRKISWVIKNTLSSDYSVLIGPELAEKINVMNGDSVMVETPIGKAEFAALIEEDQFPDVILVPAFLPQGRQLLGWDDDLGFIPTTAKIKKV